MLAIRAVQVDCQWLLKNGGNSHRSHYSTIHFKLPRNQCSQGVSQSIFESVVLTAGKHVSWPTDGPKVTTKLGMWNSLVLPGSVLLMKIMMRICNRDWSGDYRWVFWELVATILNFKALSWFEETKSTLVQVMAWYSQANIDPDLCHHIASPGHNELKRSQGAIIHHDKR